jgi:hypothetical protein
MTDFSTREVSPIVEATIPRTGTARAVIELTNKITIAANEAIITRRPTGIAICLSNRTQENAGHDNVLATRDRGMTPVAKSAVVSAPAPFLPFQTVAAPGSMWSVWAIRKCQ